MGHLLKHPDLPISCRPWHPMPIVMEEGHLLPGRPPEHSGQPPNLLHSAVGFRLCLYLALGSHLSFWSCRFPPIVSSALCISCSNITCTYSSPVTCPTWGWEGPPSTPVWHRAGSWLCLGGPLLHSGRSPGLQTLSSSSLLFSMSAVNMSPSTLYHPAFSPAWSCPRLGLPSNVWSSWKASRYNLIHIIMNAKLHLIHLPNLSETSDKPHHQISRFVTNFSTIISCLVIYKEPPQINLENLW